jgi:hypothetical protein
MACPSRARHFLLVVALFKVVYLPVQLAHRTQWENVFV